ncbi:MAG: heparan-alpha-glucosaminide N-acetyltransferase domain-containing protein [bacterium]|nr:heparan-alpha-glucosaminide N-acetyltransferase domain-containing protein [bacterium]
MPRPAERLLAIDWLRGIVMILMAMDHVDQAVNPNHFRGDSAIFPWATAPLAESPISPPDFILRWFTHLCAPTFVLLAGVSIALSATNASARGMSHGRFDRHIVLRGAVIVLLELTVISAVWRYAEGQGAWGLTPIYPLVLWAIGGSMMLMPLVRRLPAAVLLAISGSLMLWSELTPSARFSDPDSLFMTTFLRGGLWSAETPPTFPPDVICFYPLLTWLPVMLVGVVLGRRLVAGRLTPRFLFAIGAAAIVTFVALRFFNEFGNQELPRRSNDLLEWLRCSKYPPSLTFLGLELGLAFWLLALLMRCEPWLARLPRFEPVATLGRTPLFYYLLHLPMIGALMWIGLLPGRHEGNAATSLYGTLAVALACWPCCLAYGWYKQRYRHAWTRYL